MLKDLSKGERFKELPGLIVKKAFDIKQSEAKDGQPGKLRQGLILTDGTAEMGFTLWGPDIGTVMEGDMLTLMGGWVHGWEGSDGAEKLDLRLRKEGSWAKTGSGVTIPQAPPVTAKTDNALEYVDIPARSFPDAPPLSPGARAVLNDAAVIDRRITKLACLKAAARMYQGGYCDDAMPVIEAATQMYDWAMKDEPRPQEPLGAEPAEGTGEALETEETGPEEATGDAEAMPWHKRSAVIFEAGETIPYYNHPAHIIATLGILEMSSVIHWIMSDEAVLKHLEAYAKARADEKAAAD